MTIFLTTFLHTTFLTVLILGCMFPLLALLNVSYGLGAAGHILSLSREWSMCRLSKMLQHLFILALNVTSLYFQLAMLLQSIGILNVHGSMLLSLTKSTDFNDVSIENIGIIPTFSAHILGFALPVFIGRYLIQNMARYFQTSEQSTNNVSTENPL